MAVPNTVASAFIPHDFLSTLSPQDIFGTAGPIEVDLGCGDGGFLLAMAQHYPERNFLGIERLLGRVRAVCRKAIQHNIANVKVTQVESRYFLEWMLQPGDIARLHYLFPDPWPKEKHHKKRLVQADFLPVLHRALMPNGEFLFKTDHQGYFDQVCELMQASDLFRSLDWHEQDFFYPETDFQRQWQAMGRAIYHARFVRTD